MIAKVALSFLQAHQVRSAEDIEKLCTENVVVHGPGWEILGINYYLESQRRIWKEIPRQRLAAENVIEGGDAVAVQWIDHSSHPTADGEKDVITTGCSVFKFKDNKISDVEVYSDGVDVIRQLSEK